MNNSTSFRSAITFILFFQILTACSAEVGTAFIRDIENSPGENIPSTVVEKYIPPGMSVDAAKNLLENEGFDFFYINRATENELKELQENGLKIKRAVRYVARKEQRRRLITKEVVRIWFYAEEGKVVASAGDRYFHGL